MTKILDCTLRDGGYYNDWNFPIDIAERTIRSLDQAGVSIIELGLKSAADHTCSGLFKYCNENYLRGLDLSSQAAFSFMLNVKEFISDGAIDVNGLDNIILPADASVFQICRLAAHYGDFRHIEGFFQYFSEKGYRVGINLMGVSLLSKEQLQTALETVESLQPEVFYIADSFGSMLPEDISALVETIRGIYSGAIGIHTHDNQGLAFTNSLRAIDLGVEYIDSTLTGMGRGAGNLATEQILLWLQNKAEDKSRYHSGKVLEIIQDYFASLKKQYGWGFNYVYMLSGLNNIHPVYCMELCDGNKFSTSQVSAMLESIPRENRASFNRQSLQSSINSHSSPNPPAEEQSQGIPLFDAASYTVKGERCLIVSTGPDIATYSRAMKQLIATSRMQVIECNDSNAVNEIENRLTVILNRMRLNEYISRHSSLPQPVVTGESSLEIVPDPKLFHYPYSIGPIAFQKGAVTIPDYEAGQYAISLAVSLGYREILLAGFMGYNQERNTVMDRYFEQLKQLVPDITLTAVTPTHYRILAKRSLFTL